LFTTGAVVNQLKAQPEVSVSVDFNTFYNDLSPYGQWINTPQYGEAWVYNEQGFRPYYTNGHWDYTDYGWTWVSDYDWGWAPFHYGRWEYDAAYGWMWIPGYEWAPAWVTWSEDNDYYGWAPMGYGVSFGVSIGSIPYNWWVFAPRQYITSPRIADYYVPFARNRSIIRNVSIINNSYSGRNGYRYWRGPERGEVERITNSRLQPRRIDNDRRYGLVMGNNRGNNYNRNYNGGRNNNVGRTDDRRDFGQRNDGFRRDIQPQPRVDNGQRNFDNRNNGFNNGQRNNNGWRNQQQPQQRDNNNFPQQQNDRRGNWGGRENRPQQVPQQQVPQQRNPEPRNNWQQRQPDVRGQMNNNRGNWNNGNNGGGRQQFQQRNNGGQQNWQRGNEQRGGGNAREEARRKILG